MFGGLDNSLNGHMEQIEEDYFFGESDPYNDECPIAHLRNELSEMFPIGGPFQGTPMAVLADAEDRLDEISRQHRRLLCCPFRDNDRWSTSAYTSLKIADMADSHLSNCCAWICRNQKQFYWWTLMRMEFELLRRGVERTGIDLLIPAIEKHRDRCRASDWAKCELTWQETEIATVLSRQVARQD